MFKKPLYVALFLILLAAFFYATTGDTWYQYDTQTTSIGGENNIAGDVSFYKNKNGAKWSVPKGDYDFSIASGMEKYPKFISGKVDPADVQVGDTQKMEIVVADSVPIKTVIAKIQTDTGIKEVPMKLVSSKTLSEEYFKSQEYLVDENGKLVINDKRDNNISNLINGFVKKAEAQAIVEYIYHAEWVVSDTHRETYRTTFLATDENGETNDYVIAWSDPCDFDSAGYLQINCSYATGVDGVDGKNINLNGNIINLTGGSAVLGFNSGYSISIRNGSIGISGGTVQKTNLYYADADGDTYAPSIAMSTTGGSGKIRVKDSLTTNYSNITTNLDCNDGSNSYYPNNPNYYYSSGDYNCSGAIEGGFSGSTATTSTIFSQISYKLNFSTCSYSNYIPDFSVCGTSSNTIYECGYYDAYGPSGKSFAVNILENLKSIFFLKSFAAPDGSAGYYSGKFCQNCFPYPGTAYTLCH